MFPPKLEATNTPIKIYREETVTALCCIKERFQISNTFTSYMSLQSTEHVTITSTFFGT